MPLKEKQVIDKCVYFFISYNFSTMLNKEPPLHGKPQCKFTCTLEMDEQYIENLDLSNNI
jgi:hypothetical protein